MGSIIRVPERILIPPRLALFGLAIQAMMRDAGHVLQGTHFDTLCSAKGRVLLTCIGLEHIGPYFGTPSTERRIVENGTFSLRAIARKLIPPARSFPPHRVERLSSVGRREGPCPIYCGENCPRAPQRGSSYSPSVCAR